MNLATCLLAAGALASAPAVAFAEDEPMMDVAARQAADTFGHCVAKSYPRESQRVLLQDFRSARYRIGIRLLAEEARRCGEKAVGVRGSLSGSGLLIAGAVAENLLETGDEPLNARLVRAAGASVETFGPGDAVAQCLARSLPDEVAALFATDPGSAQEISVAANLGNVVEPCSRAANLDEQIVMSVAAIRATTATAALRLIAKFENSDA